MAGGCDALHKGRARTGPLRCARSQRKAGKRPRLVASWAFGLGHASHQGNGRERCNVFYTKAVRWLMVPAGINGGDEAGRNGGLGTITYLRRFSTSAPSRARASISASEKPRPRSTASPCSLKRGDALRVPPGVRDSLIGVPRPR